MTLAKRKMELIIQQAQLRSLQQLEAVAPVLMTSIGLSEVEVQMIRNERNSPTLRSLNSDDQWNCLANVWKEIKILTGAILHPPGKMLEIQFEVLHRFLASAPKFVSLTKTEILHAFYLNNSGEYGDIIRHYNQELNAEFVGSVLNAFVRKKLAMYRDHRSAIEGTLNPKVNCVPVYSSEDYMVQIQQDYDWYRSGDADVRIIGTSPKYIFLRRRELIQYSSKEKYWSWYRKASAQRERFVISQALKSKSRIAKEQAIDLYTAIRETGVTTLQEHRNTIWLLRRLAYLKFFEVIASCAINNIFSEIEYKGNGEAMDRG